MKNRIHSALVSGAIIGTLVLAATTAAFASEGTLGSGRTTLDRQATLQVLDNSGQGNGMGLLHRNVPFAINSSLQVSPNGDFKAKGVMVTSSSITTTGGIPMGTVSVKLFGLSATVKVDSNTRIDDIPLAGDRISIEGMIDSTTGMIFADRIRLDNQFNLINGSHED